MLVRSLLTFRRRGTWRTDVTPFADAQIRVAETSAETGEDEHVPIEPRSFMAIAIISPTAYLAR